MTIPSFFLYGETPREVDDRFLHAETIDERSGPRNWMIRPHAHPDLHHVIFLSSGGGEFTADLDQVALSHSCLILVPAGTVHGFVWQTGTTGIVVTVSESCLRHVIRRNPCFASLFEAAAVISDGPDMIEMPRHFGRLLQESSCDAPGRDAAIEAAFLDILVGVLRLDSLSRSKARTAQGPRAQLVARFRTEMERDFRLDLRISDYAARLGVSIGQLRAACITVAGRAPVQLLQDRRMIEAKRGLLYTDLSISDIAYDLGFDDPAYFSRFFADRAGCPPRLFRDRATQNQ